MRVEIGIPLLSGVALAEEVLHEIIKFKSPSVIHISINEPGGQESEYLALESLDPRVKVSCQPRNLGLYGNFRFLVENATGDYFHWHCFDDQISETVLKEAVLILEKESANLAVIPFFSQECFLQPLRWAGPKSEGEMPVTVSRDNRFTSFIYAQPSWIFGLWKTDYLKATFPRQSFDWLDTYLLQRVLLEGKVVSFQTDNPLTIGTWNWKGKVPNANNGRRFRVSKSIFLSGLCLLRNGYLSEKSQVIAFLLEARGRLILARELTKKLTKQRQ
jgi:hypothetical protein